MRIGALLVVVFLLVCPGPKSCGQDTSCQQFVGQLDWIINRQCHRGNFTVLDNNHLLTCAHVLKHGKLATTEVHCEVQKKLFAAEVLWSNTETDLAMLAPLEEVSLKSILPEKETKIIKGDELIVYGHTFAEPPPQQYVCRVLEITAFHFTPEWDFGGNQTVAVVDQSLPDGLSGSGVFTKDGKLVGITSGCDRRPGQDHGLLSPLTLLRVNN